MTKRERGINTGRELAREKIDAGRFWLVVTKGDPDKCWTWEGALFASGYGQFSLSRKHGRQGPFLAHRTAYALTHGVCPAGLLVRHTCDNKVCVNPKHLVLGTPKDNSADMVARGRSAHQFRPLCACGAPRWKLIPRHTQCENCVNARKEAARVASRARTIASRKRTNQLTPDRPWSGVVQLVGERNAEIFARNHGLYQFNQPERLAVIAKDFHISRERARQIVLRTAQHLGMDPKTFWGGLNQRYKS